MARSRSTFGKMQREQEKRSRARAKQEKRFARKDEQPEDEEGGEAVATEDQASILEALARLHEDFAEGRISFDFFEERQEQLRSSIRVD
ncbi:MAG: hypothetical protein WAM97_02015 [Acidimicrobiales bacterium]